MRSPFEILGMTPQLVAVLKNKPSLLRKIALHNRKYLQTVYHPDISGNKDFSIELNTAIDAIDDDYSLPYLVDKYISEHLSHNESVREKILKKDLHNCREKFHSLKSAIAALENSVLDYKIKNKLLSKKLTHKINLIAQFLIDVFPERTHSLLLPNINNILSLSSEKKYLLIVGRGNMDHVYLVDGKSRRCKFYFERKSSNKKIRKKINFPNNISIDDYILGIWDSEEIPKIGTETFDFIKDKIAPVLEIGKSVISGKVVKNNKIYIQTLGILKNLQEIN